LGWWAEVRMESAGRTPIRWWRGCEGRADGRRPYFRRKYEAALDQWIRAMAERR
jgi:hypothetical protein